MHDNAAPPISQKGTVPRQGLMKLSITAPARPGLSQATACICLTRNARCRCNLPPGGPASPLNLARARIMNAASGRSQSDDHSPGCSAPALGLRPGPVSDSTIEIQLKLDFSGQATSELSVQATT